MKSMKMIFLTDIHQNIRDLEKIKFEKYDIVICGGDIIDPTNINVEISLEILNLLPQDTVIVYGNCDKDKRVYERIWKFPNNIDRKYIEFKKIKFCGIGMARPLLDDINTYREFFCNSKENIINFVKEGGPNFILKFSGVKPDGTIFDNLPILNENKDFFDKFISFKDSEIENLFDNILLDNGIFLTHSPPFGLLDKLKGLPNIGSKTLRKLIDKTNPSLVLCGHFHENQSILNFDNKLIFNPGAFKDGFYGIIEYDGKYSCYIEKI